MSEDLVFCCFKMNQLLQAESTEKLANNGIDEIREGCKGKDGEMAARTVSVLFNLFMSLGNRESESNLTLYVCEHLSVF